MDDLFEAQIEIAKKAAGRWKERSDTRIANEVALREKGIAAVETPERIARHRDHVSGPNLVHALNPEMLPPDARAERIIGIDDRRKLPETQQEIDAGRPVARIVRIFGPDIQPQGFGSGFLVGDRLLLTNNHVLPSKRSTEGIGANFGHDYVPGGGTRAGEVFELDADGFFVTDEALDFTLVAIKPRSLAGAELAAQGHHRLIKQTGKILIGKPVSIIQHPMGGAKQYATAGNKLVDLLELHLHYQTDTEPGASGSPVFSEFWKIVALHHSGVPMTQGDQILDVNGDPWDGRDWDHVQWVANEGVRISRILAHLQDVAFDDPAQAALRDALLTASQTPPPEESVPAAGAATVVRTGSTRQPAQSPTGDGTAQTIVHVHGNADVYTGPVVQQGGTAALAPAMTESAPAAALEKAMVFDPHYGRRRGFSPHFLRGHLVDMPRIDPARQAELARDRFDNPMVLDYHHFSLVMNADWKLVMWSAVNVDYSPEVRWNMSRADFGSDKWMHDPRISEALQIDNEELYAPARKFDRGHVVRRDDNAWGVTREEVILANSDTFHWTNCTPQHENFNRSNRRGIWGKLENHIADQAGAVGNRVMLFSGPVLDPARSIPHDFGGGLYRVPLDFWKVIVVAEPRSRGDRSDLRAYGFLLEQEKAIDDHGLEALPVEERFDIGEFAPQQRPLKALQERSGILFPDNVLKADVMTRAADDSAIPLERLDSVKLD